MTTSSCEVPVGPEPTDYEAVERVDEVGLEDVLVIAERHLRRA